MSLAPARDVINTFRLLCASTLAAVACGGVTAGTVGLDDAGVDATQPDGSRDAATNDAVSISDGGAADASDAAPRDAAIDNDPNCPSDYGSTGACTKEGLTCRYAEGRCDCQRPCSGVFVPDASWGCTAAHPECPDDPPATGAPCAPAGAHCVYPGCCTMNDFTCANGVWDAAPPFCPP